MIINPSAHTVIPRRNTLRKSNSKRRRRTHTLSLPGGKLLWQEGGKVFAGAVILLCLVSFFINASVTRVTGDIEKMEAACSVLVDTNIVLRAERAKLFSPEAVEVLAGNRLSIHPPGPEQYYKF